MSVLCIKYFSLLLFFKHTFSSTVKSGLLKSLKRELSKTSKTPCGKLGPIIYTKHIEEFVQMTNSWWRFEYNTEADED